MFFAKLTIRLKITFLWYSNCTGKMK